MPIVSLWVNKMGISSTRSVVTVNCSVISTAYRIFNILSPFDRTVSYYMVQSAKMDVDLSTDDEKIRVFGKGQRERTVMLTAAPESVRLLRRHLKQSHITSGSVFRGDPRYGEVLSRWTTAWPTTPGRNIVRKPRSRPRFTNCAIVEPASSCKQEYQSRRCASSWATAISKVPSSMQKWINPLSSTICSATTSGKGGSGSHGEGTPGTHLGEQQRGGPSLVYLDAG